MLHSARFGQTRLDHAVPAAQGRGGRSSGDIYATQQLPGHADVSTTANIYVQSSPADLERKLDQVWGD